MYRFQGLKKKRKVRDICVAPTTNYLLFEELGKLHLINQLDEEDKITVFKIVDTMLTKKKFKDFFAKNVAML
jgi:hypothetical protein